MWAFLRAYFTYRKDPVLVMRGLVRQRRFGMACLGYAVAALCWVCFFWIGGGLSGWGFLWRFVFFWLLEFTAGYLWAALSGLFLNFFAAGNGPSALFIAWGLSGFVQGLLLCWALVAEAGAAWLHILTLPVFVLTLGLRVAFAAVNAARAMKASVKKVLGALCFAIVPVAAAGCLSLGVVLLLLF